MNLNSEPPLEGRASTVQLYVCAYLFVFTHIPRRTTRMLELGLGMNLMEEKVDQVIQLLER